MKTCFWCGRNFNDDECVSVTRKVKGEDKYRNLHFCRHKMCTEALEMIINSNNNEELHVSGHKLF